MWVRLNVLAYNNVIYTRPGCQESRDVVCKNNSQKRVALPKTSKYCSKQRRNKKLWATLSIDVFVKIFMCLNSLKNVILQRQTTPHFDLIPHLQPISVHLGSLDQSALSRTTTQLIFLQSLVCDVDVTQQLSAGFVLLHSLCSAWSRKCTKTCVLIH